MGRVKSFVYGFAVGSVTAGVAILLNAPKPGKEIRDDLKDKWDEFNYSVSDIKGAVVQAKSNIEDIKTKGLPLLRSTMNDVMDLVETWRQDVQPHISKILQDSKSFSEETKRIATSRKTNDED